MAHSNCSRREFIQRVGGAAAVCMMGRASADTAPAKPPNIVVVLCDDMGYGDLGCYGGSVATPNIDRLARGGARFTDCYAAAPLCSPSRAGLMTGRIPARTGLYSYIPPDHPMHLPRSEVTVATLLQRAGYATGHFGKWHLCDLANPEQPQPLEHGFDYIFGTSNNAEPTHMDPVNFVRNGTPLGKIEGYSCQIVAGEAIGWLDRLEDSDQPFFMYVCLHEPHRILASPPELMAKYPDASPEDALYFANIANIDLAVGRLLAALDAQGAADDTLVFFTSDNGPLREGSQGPLRDNKSEIYDGGIRVPGIVRWPGHVEAGATSHEPISFVDFLPTACALAGAPVPDDRPIDGINLLPLLRGEGLNRRKPLYWYFYNTRPQVALREGDWTIVGDVEDPMPQRTHWMAHRDMSFIKNAKLSRFELYNVRNDIGQRNDLAASEPDRLERMKRIVIELHEEVVAEGPTWEGLPKANGGA